MIISSVIFRKRGFNYYRYSVVPNVLKNKILSVFVSQKKKINVIIARMNCLAYMLISRILNIDLVQ